MLTKPTLYIALLTMALSGCRKEIDYYLEPTDRKIIVYAVLDADSTVSAKVLYANQIQDNSFEPHYIDNANVELLLDNQTLASLNYTNNGNYIAPKGLIQQNTPYALNVTVPGRGTLKGSALIPKKVQIKLDTVKSRWEYYTYNNGYETLTDSTLLFRLRLTIKNPDAQRDYYRVQIKQVNSSYDGYYDTIIDYESNVYINAENLPVDFTESNGRIYFTDYLFDQTDIVMEFDIQNSIYYYSTLKSIKVYLQHLTPDYYLFKKSEQAAQEGYGYGPFVEPVIIHCNVEGGIGLVAGTATTVDSVIVKPWTTKQAKSKQ